MKITLRPKLAGDDTQDVVLADGADRADDNVRGPATGSNSVSIRDQVFNAIRADHARLIGRANRVGSYSFRSSRRFTTLADAGRFYLTHGMSCAAEGTLFFEFDSGALAVLHGCTIRQIGQMEQVGVTIKANYSVAYGDAAEVAAASLQSAINAYYGYVIELALNCGGSAASPFAADAHYPTSGTETSTTEDAIGNVSAQRPEAMYQACRWSENAFTYEIPNLPDDTYTVKLHFCESWMDNVGDRVFDVALAGTTVLEAFDILDEAGSKNVAHVEEFDVAVSGGSLAITFTPSIGDPLICGIEIAPNET